MLTAEQKIIEEECVSALRILEKLERIDQAIYKAESLEGMLSDVLEMTLSIFDSDRAWLLYPCDPEAPEWRVHMERTRPEYPGALAMKTDFPTTPEVRQAFSEALGSIDPVVYDPQSGRSLPQVAMQFSVQSQIQIAIYPKIGKNWLFGMHQCSYARVWPDKDVRLFKDIARRVADGLSSLLFLNNLKESEKRFRSLVENLPVKVFVKNTDSVYVTCNPSYARDLGIDKEEIQGKTDNDFYPRELAEKYRADDKRIMDSGRGEEIEETVSRDGQRFWVQTIKIPLKDEADNVTGILGVFWDITERKNAEEELKRSNRDLEQFAYIASHDLQEPLRQVVSFAQLLQKRLAGKLDEKCTEYLEFVREGAIRMSNLVNDLLTYSRVGADNDKQEAVSCQGVLNEAMTALNGRIAETGAKITYGDLPLVLAYKIDLVRLFQNLIGNALKFQEEGVSPEVKIGAQREGQMWKLWFQDNGIGIDPEHHDKIFLPFRRLHSRDKYPGSGIGLAICRRIVEQHGGRIWVESKPGQGSTFFFTLPEAKKEKL